MNDEGIATAYFIGILTSVAVFIVMWYIAESACQAANNVYDCEWSQSPFTPTQKEAEQ